MKQKHGNDILTWVISETHNAFSFDFAATKVI